MYIYIYIYILICTIAVLQTDAASDVQQYDAAETDRQRRERALDRLESKSEV